MDPKNMRATVIPPVAPPPVEEAFATGETESTTPNSSFFVPFILMLDPLEFYVVGVVIAVIISLELRPAEQDAVGTFIELIGFSLGAIATQGLYLEDMAAKEEEKKQEIEFKKLIKEVDELKKTVAELKKMIPSNP